MSLLRFLARSLFASAFIVDGVRKVTSPTDVAPEAEKFTSRVTPVMQRIVPAQYSSHVPERPESWIRLCGAAEVVGGALFATGICRRVGALLLSGASTLNLAAALPAKDAPDDEKQTRRPEVLTRVALLGASVLATQDLQGRPSAAWRRKHSRRAKASHRRKAKQAVAS
ncbi:MAG: DoxX family protein [Propionibacteriaceae bacterium]|nr:DoxX family protein [Propionibacteriaceae bacterium]